MKTPSYQLGAVLAAILLASCGGKDPRLVKKAADQQTEIARLRGELGLLDEQLKNLPQDRSAELAEARKTAEAEKAFLQDFVLKAQANVQALQALMNRLNTPPPACAPARRSSARNSMTTNASI